MIILASLDGDASPICVNSHNFRASKIPLFLIRGPKSANYTDVVRHLSSIKSNEFADKNRENMYIVICFELMCLEELVKDQASAMVVRIENPKWSLK